MCSSTRGNALLSAAMILVAAACSSGDDAAPATDVPVTPPPSTNVLSGAVIEVPEWRPATRNEELAWEISQSPDGPTVQQAVDTFGLVVADFPGVSASDLPVEEERSSSYALTLIQSVADRLAAEQAAALDAYLADGTTVATMTPDGTIELTGETPDTAGSGWRRPQTAEIERYSALLAEVQQAWDEKLPTRPKQQSYELQFTNNHKAGGMEASPEGSMTKKCVIGVHPSFLAGNPSDDQIRFYFAHELFHCMQFHWASKASVWMPHKWVFDGSADWAAADLFRDWALDFNDLRVEWFSSAHQPLGAREYDAWPLFENAYLNQYSVYQLISDMFKEPRYDVDAMLAVGHLDGVVFRSWWSSRTLRRATWGDEWKMDWVWFGKESSGPTNNQITVNGIAIGSYKFDGPDEFSQPQLRVPVAADVGLLTVSPVGSPITTRTAVGTRTVGDGGAGRFCFEPSGCVCPSGQSADAWPMEKDNEMLFSFAASEDRPTSTLVAEQWDPEKHCRQPEPKEGSSNGDPHIVTFDGLPYDLMTLGEFVAARDAQGDLEVQTRHEPFQFAAGTSAVAIGTGDHRIAFTMADFLSTDPVTVRVDGAETTESELRVGDVLVSIAGDTVIAGSDATATWPDGSTIRLHWAFGWWVVVTVTPERAARMEGLLGAADGDLRNDLVLPDGTIVDTSEAALDQSAYSLAWAVDEPSSLFDYAAGQSVATFRVPHPDPTPVVLADDVVAGCEAALGEQAAAHEVTSCAFDVTVTGEQAFVDEYVDVVDERRDGAELGDVEMTLPVPATEADGTIAPAVAGVAGQPALILGGEQTGTVDAVAGAVLLARTENCGDGYVDVVVAKADDSTALARAPLCDPSGLPAVGLDDDDEWVNGEAYVWIPGDGAYDVAVEVTLGDADTLGPVELYADPSPTIVDTAALADGDQTTLRGVGDTLAYFPDPAATFATTGLDTACATDVYWGDRPFPSAEPFALAACQHRAEVSFPPTDIVVPVVVVNRLAGDVVVELTPSG